MRAYHVVLVVAVILVGVAVKLIFFATPIAEANSQSIKPVSLDVSQVHPNIKGLPTQQFNDRSLVFRR
jgi:hypothetical protein